MAQIKNQGAEVWSVQDMQAVVGQVCIPSVWVPATHWLQPIAHKIVCLSISFFLFFSVSCCVHWLVTLGFPLSVYIHCC